MKIFNMMMGYLWVLIGLCALVGQIQPTPILYCATAILVALHFFTKKS